MFHELATNALKYGALSNGAGAVLIHWRLDTSGGEPRAVIHWTEQGGPPVTPPAGTGQGTRFIKGSVHHELNGEVTLDFRPEGLGAKIVFPLAGAANVAAEPSDTVGRS